MKGYTLVKFELIAIVLVILVLTVTIKPSLTGFVPMKSHNLPLNLTIIQSQVYHLKSNETLDILSFAVSGMVVGNGTASVWLDDGVNRSLVYTNIRQPQQGGNWITGMATISVQPGPVTNEYDSLPDGASAKEGSFYNECIETCIMNGVKRDSYDLIIRVQPGTAIVLDEIVYIFNE